LLYAKGDAKAGFNKGGCKLIKRKRIAKQIALIMVAAVSLKKLPLVFGFSHLQR